MITTAAAIPSIRTRLITAALGVDPELMLTTVPGAGVAFVPLVAPSTPPVYRGPAVGPGPAAVSVPLAVGGGVPGPPSDALGPPLGSTVGLLPGSVLGDSPGDAAGEALGDAPP